MAAQTCSRQNSNSPIAGLHKGHRHNPARNSNSCLFKSDRQRPRSIGIFHARNGHVRNERALRVEMMLQWPCVEPHVQAAQGLCPFVRSQKDKRFWPMINVRHSVTKRKANGRAVSQNRLGMKPKFLRRQFFDCEDQGEVRIDVGVGRVVQGSDCLDPIHMLGSEFRISDQIQRHGGRKIRC